MTNERSENLARIFPIVGLVGGILAVAGVFGTWLAAGVPGTEISVSGWDLTRGVIMGMLVLSLKLPYLVIVGGALAVIGSLLALLKPGVIAKVVLVIGGITILIGGALGFVLFEVSAILAVVPGMPAGFTVGAGYGVYLLLVGGILAILATLGLREKPE